LGVCLSRITFHRGNKQTSSLAWTGAEYGIAYWDSRSGSSEVYFSRIGVNGKSLGEEVKVNTHKQWSGYPSLAWTGSEYGIAWQDHRHGQAEIYFARLGPGGNTFGETRVTFTAKSSEHPSLLWTGSNFALAWDDQRHYPDTMELYFARLAADGQTIDETRLTYLSNYSRNPSLIWTGSEYGVAWEDSRDQNDLEIFYKRFQAGSASPGEDVRLTRALGTSRYPALVWTASELGLAWLDKRNSPSKPELFFRRLHPGGQTIGEEGRLSWAATNARAPSLVWTGSEYAVAWEDVRNGISDIFMLRLGPSGSRLGEEMNTSGSAWHSYKPTMVWTGSEYSLAFTDSRYNDLELFLGRFRP